MVPIDFYQYRRDLWRVLLTKMDALQSAWDPFTAAWICYALSIEGIKNNQPLIELRDSMLKWLGNEESAWKYRRNLGPIALLAWLSREGDQEIRDSPVDRLVNETQKLHPDDKWSPLRDPEQVFLLALGLKVLSDESAKTHLRNAAREQMNRGPLKRRILYAASLKELGEDVSCPQGDSSDEGDLIALVWWAEKYGGDRQRGWEYFASIQDRIAFGQETVSSNLRFLSDPELAMLYEAVAKQAQNPEPMLLFEYFPLHKRVKEVVRKSFQNGDYVGAVLQATQAFNELIQQQSGITDKNEAELVQATMKQIGDPSRLRICFNAFLNEDSGKSEQAGLALICEGIFRAFRNPKAHKPADHPLVQLTAYEALEQLIVISYLIKRIENASVQSP